MNLSTETRVLFFEEARFWGDNSLYVFCPPHPSQKKNIQEKGIIGVFWYNYAYYCVSELYDNYNKHIFPAYSRGPVQKNLHS